MMMGKNDDAARAREDSFLGELIPQVTEHLAAQHSREFDADAGRARFMTWLTAHSKGPADHPEIIIADRKQMEPRRLEGWDDDQTLRFHSAEKVQAQHAWTHTSKGAPIGIADLIRDVNKSSDGVEDQFLRARQAADAAVRSARAAEEAEAAAEAARVAHQTIQAERPRRRSPLPRQVILAALTVALDGVACYFAAQALGASQDSTLVWTALFLAVLAGGEVALDFYRDRNLRAWQILALTISAFVGLLGVLRFWFLATVGTGGLVPAFIGAGLFTAATAGFLALGYRALRAAETPQAWRARRAARAARQAARAARATADRDVRERDRLIDAYLSYVRKVVLRTIPVDQQIALESAVRELLSRNWT